MLGFKKRKKVKGLDQQLADTNARLALLKVELAAQMVKLAGQSEDLAPLKQAEEALSSARNHYSFETTPVEIGMVQTALGDMLLKLGRLKSDKSALTRAREAYRASITLASMHGHDDEREDLRAKIKMIDSLLGRRPPTPSLFKVA